MEKLLHQYKKHRNVWKTMDYPQSVAKRIDI